MASEQDPGYIPVRDYHSRNMAAALICLNKAEVEHTLSIMNNQAIAVDLAQKEYNSACQKRIEIKMKMDLLNGMRSLMNLTRSTQLETKKQANMSCFRPGLEPESVNESFNQYEAKCQAAAKLLKRAEAEQEKARQVLDMREQELYNATMTWTEARNDVAHILRHNDLPKVREDFPYEFGQLEIQTPTAEETSAGESFNKQTMPSKEWKRSSFYKSQGAE